MVTPTTLIYKVLFPSISTFETPPAQEDLEEPSLMELARVIKAAPCIETSFQRGKGEAGMDAYQVRTWEG